MNLGESFGVMVVGILVVFLGLIILIVCIRLMSAMFLKPKSKPAASPVPQEAASPVQAAPTVQNLSVDSNPPAEVVAAITAAIAMLLEPHSKFIVKRIKRTNKIN